MTKRELIQQVKDLAGVEFGDRTVIRHLNNAFITIAGQLFRQDPTQYQYYSKPITLDVEDRVALIPIALIQTPSNGKGIPAMTDMAGTTDFYPVPYSALNARVDANDMSIAVFYSVTGNVVRFNRSLPMGEIQVKATVIPELQGYEDEEFINLPAGAANMIIDMAVASVKGDPSYQNIHKSKQQ